MHQLSLENDGKSIRIGATKPSDGGAAGGGPSGSDLYTFSAAYGPTTGTTDLFSTV